MISLVYLSINGKHLWPLPFCMEKAWMKIKLQVLWEALTPCVVHASKCHNDYVIFTSAWMASILMHYPLNDRKRTKVCQNGPTVKCGIPEFCLRIPDALFVWWKRFVAIIMYSKRRFLYASAYRWIVNALTPIRNPALGWHNHLVRRVVV